MKATSGADPKFFPAAGKRKIRHKTSSRSILLPPSPIPPIPSPPSIFPHTHPFPSLPPSPSFPFPSLPSRQEPETYSPPESRHGKLFLGREANGKPLWLLL